MAKKATLHLTAAGVAPPDIERLTGIARDLIYDAAIKHLQSLQPVSRQDLVCVLSGMMSAALSVLGDVSNNLGQPWTNEKHVGVSLEVGAILTREIEAIVNRFDSHELNMGKARKTGVAAHVAPTGSCDECGNLCTCTCEIARDHQPWCRFLVAARCPVELECEHGFQACPICDPCNCGSACGHVNAVF